MATTTEALPATAPRRPPTAVRFVIAFLVGLVAVGALGGGVLYAFDQQYAGKILPGVHIGDVDVSGLSPAAASTSLGQAFAGFSSGRVVLRGAETELTIGYAEIGRAPDVDAMVVAALAAGRAQGTVGSLVATAQTALRGVRLEPAVVFDRARLAEAIEAVAAVVDRAPSEASIAVLEGGTYDVRPSTDGRRVDQAALTEALAAALTRLDAPAELEMDLPIVPLAPVVDTADATAARQAAERMTTDILITQGDESWTITTSQLRALVSFSPTVDGGLTPILDVAALDPLLAPIAKSVNRAPKDASFLLSRTGSAVGVRAGHDGRALDVEATRALLVDTMLARRGGNEAPAIAPVVVTTRPALTTEEAERTAPLMQEISRWKTYFPIGIKNGYGANIWIPSSLIDGYVVRPGETFDFWKAVGPVSRDRGFTDGGAIINGRTEPQGALAGGICSTSTTLFNAALRAGFEMKARRYHYYYIDRYPLGLDATVFISGSSVQTMSWRNDTAHPVLIRGINTRSGNAGYVTFVLYSVPTGRKVVIGDPVVKNVRPASDSVEYTSTMKAGVRQRVEYPVEGKDVWRTVTVYENGQVLRRTTYYSHYARITGVVLVGTGGSTPKPTPAPTPDPTPTPEPSPTP